MSPLTRAFRQAYARRGLLASGVNLVRYGLTPTGRALTGTLIVSGSVAVVIGTRFPLYLLATSLFVLVALGNFLRWAMRVRLRVERAAPSRVAAGARVTLSARVTNVGTRAARDLAVTELSPFEVEVEVGAEYVGTLPPGESVTLSYALHAPARGLYTLTGPAAISAYPFGLFHARVALGEPWALLVYPRFEPLSEVRIPANARHHPGGLQLVSKVGDSEEFLGCREYRTGDRLRDLDHRAWARRQTPVVREYQQEYLVKIALLVDTFLPRETEDTRRDLEAAISLGAAVTDALSRQEYVVELFAAGPELYHLQAGRNLAYLDTVLDVLACIEACPRDPLPRVGPDVLDAMGGVSSAVLVLLDWDEARRDLVRSLEERGVALKVVLVRTSAPTLDPTGVLTASGPVQVLTGAAVESGVETL